MKGSHLVLNLQVCTEKLMTSFATSKVQKLCYNRVFITI